MKPAPRLKWTSTLAIWLLSAGVASAYLTDPNVYRPLSYSGFLAQAGHSYNDAIFGTAVKRLSDAVGSPDAGTVSLPFVMSEYSTMSPFSNDGSRLILQHGSYYGLHDGAGDFIGLLPAEINAASEPRWARSSTRLLYYVNGNRLKQYNVDSGATSVVHTFSEYSSISGKGESDISFDGNHFVLVGNDHEIFVYEINTATKGGVLDIGSHGIDSVYITPDNHVTVTWLQAGSGRYRGIELFDSNMQFLRQLTRAGGHMDVGRDGNGDEVLLWANAADPAPVCNNGVVKVRLANASQTCLVSLDWSLALNISAPDGNGWVYVATYAPGDPDPGGGVWPAYANEVLQVALDGSQVRRLAHHRSRPLNGYNYTPRPSVSRDGTKLVFSSNFGMQMSGYPTEYADAYLVTGISTSAAPPPPGAASLVAPQGTTVSTSTPTYAWSAVAEATRYYLWVENSGGTALVSQWYDAAAAGCAGGTGSCAVTPSTTLSDGSYTWWIRTSNGQSAGPWSSPATFTVAAPGVPAATTLLSPAGSIGTQTPTYSWAAVSSSTWYYLWIDGPGGEPAILQWYTAAQAGCAGGGTCSVTPSIALAASGAHHWWIRTWNSFGSGPWSARGDIVVTGAGSPPPVATLIGPSGTVATSTPTYKWNAVGGSTWYLVWVGKTDGTRVFQIWINAAVAGCGAGVATCSAVPTPGGPFDPPALASGGYKLYVQTWSPGGYGPWSAPKAFTVQ